MIFYGDSVVGMVRKVNEDSCVVKSIAEDCILAVVADGMGGHRGGKNASTVAMNCICEYICGRVGAFKDYTDVKIRRLLESAAQEAKMKILNQAINDERLRGMGTTIVVCLVVSDKYYVISAGDSRMYLCSDSLTQITRDHSYVNELVELGLITAQDARTHPNKNIITRALGTEQSVEFDFYTGNIDSGQSIMLCSDGLTNMVDDDDIFEVLCVNRTPKKAVKQLLDLANNNGGTDNISIIVIKNNKKGGVEK